MFIWLVFQLHKNVNERQAYLRMTNAMKTQAKVDSILAQFNGARFLDVIVTVEPVRKQLSIPMYYVEVNNHLAGLNTDQILVLLQRHYVGRDEMLLQIVETVKDYIDATNPDRPNFTLLTGVSAGGKTSLVTLLATLFGILHTVTFIQIDGASLIDESSTALICGAMPGLVGSELAAFCLAQKLIDADEYYKAAINAGKPAPKIILLIDEFHLIHPRLVSRVHTINPTYCV